MIPEDLVLVEADITPDEWAAPSDIWWRIVEIHVEREHCPESNHYRRWLIELVDFLLFVEQGGV